MNPLIKRLLTLGTIIAPGPQPLVLRPEHLARHGVIVGSSGSGKSYLIEMILRQLIGHGLGFTFYDPHPDSWRRIVQYLDLMSVDPAQVHVLRVGKNCFSLDPFAGMPKGLSRLEALTWLSARVDVVLSSLLRLVPAGDQEVMSRLKRWLRAILFCVAVTTPDGRRLGLSEALTLTDPTDPDFRRILEKLSPHLPKRIRRYMERLAGMRPEKAEEWLGSTTNCLDKLLHSPVVRMIFSQRTPSISLREVILKSQFQIVVLEESDELSRDAGNALGGLHMHLMMKEARAIAAELPEAQRVFHLLCCDEAHRFIADDIGDGFIELRKAKMAVLLGVQDLKGMRR